MVEKITLWSLVVVLIITNIISLSSRTNDDDISRINELEHEKSLLIKQNNQLNFKIKSFENEIIHNDSIINNSNINQLDSMFTNYFGR